MTRLERIKEQIKTDDGLIDVLLKISLDIDYYCNDDDACRNCYYGEVNESGEYDCYMFERPEGFECPRKSVRECLIEYLNEEEP